MSIEEFSGALALCNLACQPTRWFILLRSSATLSFRFNRSSRVRGRILFYENCIELPHVSNSSGDHLQIHKQMVELQDDGPYNLTICYTVLLADVNEEELIVLL